MRAKSLIFSTALCLQLCLALSVAATHLPVVIWHGMGASSSVGGTSELKALIEDRLGVRVLSISTGGTDAEQVYSGYFGNLDEQVEAACSLIQATDELKHGYNAVGLSQGGLFLRAVVEVCQHRGARARTLVTLGAPHQGVINIPLCTGLPGGSGGISTWPCRAMQQLLDWGAYMPWVRDHVVQAQYFRDPYSPTEYLEKNAFLPDVNNEREPSSSQRKDNLASLERLALFRFDDDFTLVPRDSAWFSVAGVDGLVAVNETRLYKEDLVGLRSLVEDRRVDFKSLPGAHMHFSFDDFEERILWPYLAASNASQTAAAR